MFVFSPRALRPGSAKGVYIRIVQKQLSTAATSVQKQHTISTAPTSVSPGKNGSMLFRPSYGLLDAILPDERSARPVLSLS
jgi:hypothetical protein